MILSGVAALSWPERLTAVNQGSLVVLLLAFIMLCMGLTLTFEDFRRIARMPRAVTIGFAAQYSIMPLLAWGVAQALNLPPHFAVGLILVGCCPGGTASNLVTYIAEADVALSVVMTVCSTLAAVVFTPLLTQLYVGAMVPVDTWLLFTQTLQVVIIPVALGVLLNRFAPRLVMSVMPIAPLMSVIGVCFICALMFAAHAESILIHGFDLILAVALLHGGGFLLWLLLCLAFWLSAPERPHDFHRGGYAEFRACDRAGQAGLSVAAARACRRRGSAVMHSLLGSVLAVWWRSRPSCFKKD